MSQTDPFVRSKRGLGHPRFTQESYARSQDLLFALDLFLLREGFFGVAMVEILKT